MIASKSRARSKFALLSEQRVETGAEVVVGQHRLLRKGFERREHGRAQPSDVLAIRHRVNVEVTLRGNVHQQAQLVAQALCVSKLNQRSKFRSYESKQE